MTIIVFIATVALIFAGFALQDIAVARAVRCNSNVWTVARPEFGGAILLWALALLLCAIWGGWI